MAEMVDEAFKMLKNRKGHSLEAIRKFVIQNYDCNKTKLTQTLIKKYLAQEFAEGRIKMMNSESNNILFNKRFALVKKTESD